MARPALLVGVWLAGVATATAVAWGAVQVVGDSVADRSLTSLPAPVVDGLAAGTPTPRPSASGTATPSPAATRRPARPRPTRPTATHTVSTTAPTRGGGSPVPTSPRPATRTATFTATGGTVAVSCTGSTATMRYASPAPGFTSEVESGGPVEVEVRFRSSGHESRIRVECAGGSPNGRVEESGSGKG